MTPGYWMAETSGVLRPVIEHYLVGMRLTPEEIAAMRAYLRQWIMAPVWLDVDDLRRDVEGLTTQEAIHAWLDRALDQGIDPL